MRLWIFDSRQFLLRRPAPYRLNVSCLCTLFGARFEKRRAPVKSAGRCRAAVLFVFLAAALAKCCGPMLVGGRTAA